MVNYNVFMKMLKNADCVMYGKNDSGWLYAVVTIGDNNIIQQQDFPLEFTCDAKPQADFIVSLQTPFETEEDIVLAQEFCCVYSGQ